MIESLGINPEENQNKDENGTICKLRDKYCNPCELAIR